MYVYLQGAAERLDRTNRDSARPLKIYHDDIRVTSLPAIGGRGFLCANQDLGMTRFFYVSFVFLYYRNVSARGFSKSSKKSSNIAWQICEVPTLFLTLI